MITLFSQSRRALAALALMSGLALAAPPVAAQDMQTIDPDAMIDGDLYDSSGTTADPAPSDPYEVTEPSPRYEEAQPQLDLPQQQAEPAYSQQASAAAEDATVSAKSQAPQTTYGEDDLIGAAEGLFGRGAEGLARLVQDILADQGEPNAYIVGREGGGAFVLGVRYGSGTLFHAVEGNMPVYWTGPSIGFDAGANAGNTFVLVYNLHDTDELYERYPAGEGQAYFVGGFHASYVRKGDVVMIPIRVGAGLRLGVNAGYMRFSREQRWLPF